jgi:hypothetical protein
MKDKILYISHDNIDKVKWDTCIDNAKNGLIYAYSFYLDAMSKNWDALILGDYKIVMPLTWNKKYSIHYLYQPFFCAQLGIFGNNISQELVNIFLENIPPKFKYWDFYLNSDNLFFSSIYPMYERNNFTVSLKNNYENLSANFSESHARNIRKARRQENTIRKYIPISHIIALASEQTKNFSPITKKDYRNFSKLFDQLHKKNMAVSYGVYSSQSQLTASCVFFFSHNRAYYILVGNHPDGKSSGASHFMIDHFIKEHAGENLLLDFEGSNVSSLAFFYKSFGASLEKYPGIKVNRLPAIAKLFRQ